MGVSGNCAAHHEPQSQLDDRAQALKQAVASTRRRGEQLDGIAGAIRIGMIGLREILSEKLVIGVGGNLEDESRNVVRKYNNFIDRFDAAVDRSKDIGAITNKVIWVLRS